LRDAGIVYDDIASVADLPRGWTDEQDGGRYRLHRRDDDALFGYAVGRPSWKKFLHPATQRLWSAERSERGVTVTPEPPPVDRFAFIGVRACDLHAIAIQDRVLTGGTQVHPRYQRRRQGAFMVALNCGVAGGTCFCVSMHTGPRAAGGYDLALTELVDAYEHRFVIEVGSEEGGSVLAELPHRQAMREETAQADAVVAHTAANMGRHLRSDDVHELLLRNLNHPRWDEVATRCLTCTNWTMVCPTCFCTTVEDSSDLTGAKTARSQRWDSVDPWLRSRGGRRACPRARSIAASIHHLCDRRRLIRDRRSAVAAGRCWSARSGPPAARRDCQRCKSGWQSHGMMRPRWRT
jgi:sulfhydrogenase subunit beta (sulfur reductase)